MDNGFSSSKETTNQSAGFFSGALDFSIPQNRLMEVHGNYYQDNNSSAASPVVVPLLPLMHSSTIFTGREIYLQRLKDYFGTNVTGERKSFLLHGMGGIGKTQICLKFTEEYGNIFSDIFWIDASSESVIDLRLRQIAQANNGSLESTLSAASVLKWISQKTNWLMIYDNADAGHQVVEKFIPPGNGGNILITSRNSELMIMTKNSMEVLKMGEGEAWSLLSNSAGLNDTSESAKQLVLKLGGVPLAIDQAGAYMMACRCPLDDYLKLYTKNQDDLMSNPLFEGASGYGSSAYGTWDISMKEIEARASTEKEYEAIAAESAVTLFKIFACLHHVDIPEEIFRNAAENYRKRDIDEEKRLGLPMSVIMLDSKTLFLDGKGEWDKMIFQEGIQVLQSFSLIRSSGKMYSIHPLVQSWCRNRISQMEIDRQLMLTRALLAWSIEADSEVDNYKFCRLLVPHIRRNNDDIEHLKSGDVYYDDVYESFAWVFHQVGNWNDAERLEIQLMQKRREKLGPYHANTLTSMANLAYTYGNQGRWDDAEKLEVEVMDARKQKLGSYHEDTLASMINLASTYKDQGRWDEAEKLEAQVIEACKEKLGSDHPLALSSMANLASTYWKQRRWDEAERLGVQVLEARKEKLGSDHPKTLTSMANLACTYKDLGRLDEAEKLEAEVLEARKEILGLDHPETLTSMGNLASTYSNQGRWDESEKLAIQVIEAEKEKLGPDHPSTLTSIANLALTYSEQGRWDEAEKLEVQVLETMKEKFGSEHPETLISMGNLISTYWKKCRWDEAEKLGTQLLDAMKEKFGSDHPDTLRCMADLAFVYWNKGRWDEAEALLGQTIELVEQSMGPQHPTAINYREMFDNFSKYRAGHFTV